jgi:hypothetical protein
MEVQFYKSDCINVVRANRKQNFLSTFMDEREWMRGVVIPSIIFVAVMNTEYFYIIYAVQSWKIVLA